MVNAVFSGPEAVPCIGNIVAERGYGSHAGNDNSSVLIHGKYSLLMIAVRGRAASGGLMRLAGTP